MGEEDKLHQCKTHVDSLLSLKGSEGLRETSYPSRSLSFLRRLKEPSPEENTPLQAKVKLQIIVSGAGLGGLATAIALRRRGHHVTVFERAPELGEVGAGIQVPPNSSRLLLKWGLEPYLQGKALEPKEIRIRRWQDGSIIGLTKLVPDFQENFGAPYYVVHRANLQLGMYKLALDLGVEVKVNSGVKEYDETGPRVTLEDGTVANADLVVAADGLKSEARRVVLQGVDQPPQKAGFAAYRAMVDAEQMRGDPDTSWLLDSPGQNLWLGHGRHAMTYAVAGGKSFNMVLSHPEHSDPSTWKQETAVEDMKKQFEGWDPCLTKVINMIQTTLKWPLLSGKPLKRWLSSSGKLVILGDAAHPMVPYMSEGAAMAVEDGAALAEVLSLVESKSQVHDALKVFQNVRLIRTGQMQEASLVNGKLWHFPDGPEQRARDAAMRAEVEGKVVIESANQWSDPMTQQWAYGYDAEEVIATAWKESCRLRAQL
ncbi:FAD/NAD(P)-binding domain-containing protein [Amniculicola lignicola CBS 123094]|uniref:FAD/NAD(P)-binding domain-containing protein n=1 Tax=Amniculicola lignicola CBS 123094 TaxID=1392246 RepID=A0A6A5X033_9PLEO|nr:FAD/NAD(P)-binding domain-containing protein [Amniculicola lignicola CBS 123094]